ncbi:MAG: hypothetical protein ACK4WC_03585 [Rubrimonas sp.]
MSAMRLLKLEDFGDDEPKIDPALLAAARAEGHAEGYAQGIAEALERAEAEDRAAVAQILERIADLDLGRAAAQAEAVMAMRPVIEALARLAVPRAAALGFDEALADAVQTRLAAAESDRVRLRCAPARVEGLAARLGPQVEIVADPDMSGAQARLEWTGGGAAFDADGCLQAAMAVIDRFFGEAEEGGTDVH